MVTVLKKKFKSVNKTIENKILKYNCPKKIPSLLADKIYKKKINGLFF